MIGVQYDLTTGAILATCQPPLDTDKQPLTDRGQIIVGDEVNIVGMKVDISTGSLIPNDN